MLSQVRSIHSLKVGALAMFDPMLRKVAAERDSSETPEHVAELLGRMHNAFGSHREETVRHVAGLEETIQTLGGRPAVARATGLRYGARSWVTVNGVGGQNHGANARNAFVFEHLEIASLRILGELASRADDEPTAAMVASCLADDEEMAATIGRNWANVTTLMLAG